MRPFMAAPRLLPSTLSTTHRGTAFEERSLRILQTHLSMSLHRVGGKSDGGIDLLGWWWLPPLGSELVSPVSTSVSPRRRLRVLAQCKAEKKKMGPKYVREMEGVLHRFLATSTLPGTPNPSSPNHDNNAFHASQHSPVALLISESPFTKSTILRALSSSIPFFLLHFPPSSLRTAGTLVGDTADVEDSSWMGTAVWNPALAGARGLLGGEMEARWEHPADGGGGGGSGRLSLWWRNQKLRSWTPEESSEGQ